MNKFTAAFALLIAGLLSITPVHAQDTREIKVAYIDREGDPFYAPSEGYGGIYNVQRQSSVAGAELAIKDLKITGRAIGATFALAHRTLREGETAANAVQTIAETEKPIAIVLDLPLNETLEAAKALADKPIALFNIRHREDSLRREACGAHLFHVIPSNAMFYDGLAQHLKSLEWTDVLVLSSNDAEDRIVASAFLASAKKFGLTIADTRGFVTGNDPRQRDANNARLLTAAADYDAIFVADHTRDFARFMPYRTVLPRPVIGAAGLKPMAWHPLWERHGAPQLNRRFFKLAKRRAMEEDWAAWVAVKSAAEVLVKSGDLTGSALPKALLNPELTLELYKGFPGSFRPWDRQLRQATLLATEEAVIGLAPVEGALHQFNTLDTLGTDEPEFSCTP
jgi:ABC transporter substrate binding protein (PQQ-dependent alcohol dehydrogenase system)